MGYGVHLYQGYAEPGGEKLRYSFLSLDRGSRPPELVAGEFGGREQTRRLARFPFDPESHLLVVGDDGYTRPLALDDHGTTRAQGCTVARGRHFVTTSAGSVYAGRPGAWRRHLLAVPPGAEDLAYWPSEDTLWTLTELPHLRWVVSLRRGWFD